MIQLIGLLLCIYVFVRGLDIGSRVEDRKSRTSAIIASLAGVIAILAAIFFFWAFIVSGNSMPNPTPPSY